MRRIKASITATVAAIIIAMFISPLAVFALSYSNIGVDVADHIIIRTGINNAIRNVGFAVLKFLAGFIDIIYNSVDTIVSINLYSLMADGFEFNGLFMPLAWAILSIPIIAIAVRLFLREDERINDDVRKYIGCVLLIIIFPAFISAAEDMRSAFADDVSSISVAGNSERLSLGNQIIGASIIDVYDSVDYGEVRYYTDKQDMPMLPTLLNINAVFNNTSEFINGISDDPSRSAGVIASGAYGISGVINRLGVRYEYDKYKTAQATNSVISIGNYTTDENGLHYYLIDYAPSDYANKILLSKAKSSDYAAKLQSLCNFDGSSYTTWETYEQDLTKALSNKISSTATNGSILDENGNDTGRYIVDLFDDLECEVLSDSASIDNIGAYFSWLGKYISGTGYPAENVYRYDFNFLYGLLILVVTLVAMIFALLRLSKLLYEVLFIEVIAPIFIAVDAGSAQGQKAKQVVTQLISSCALFAFIILVIKIYLAAILTVVQMDSFNIVVKIVLILGGAAFVVDGPDIIVKLLGIDAGVKSGYGAMRGVGAAVHTGVGATKTVGKLGKNVASKMSPTNLAEQVGKKVGSASAKRNELSSVKEEAKEEAKKTGKGAIGMGIASATAGAKYRAANSKVGSAFQQGKEQGKEQSISLKSPSGNKANSDTEDNNTSPTVSVTPGATLSPAEPTSSDKTPLNTTDAGQVTSNVTKNNIITNNSTTNNTNSGYIPPAANSDELYYDRNKVNPFDNNYYKQEDGE